MRLVFAIVGRPNVGKSTLFNRLTKSRDALVADEPGVTRDRHYGRGSINDQACIFVDTGGLAQETTSFGQLVAEQTMLAVAECDVVLLVVDGRAGRVVADDEVARLLRTSGKPVFLLVNKAEGLDESLLLSDFYALGINPIFAVAAAHGEGVSQALHDILAIFLATVVVQDEALDGLPDEVQGAQIAVVGRPNVGKSTLVNRLLGESRVLAFDEPGTTRDSISIPFAYEGKDYTLIDTAGVRRRGKVNEKLEKFSVIKSLQAIEAANVVILVLDAHQGIGTQDANLLGYILDAGKGLLIAVNKWDGLSVAERALIKRELDRKLSFVDYIPMQLISALHGSGVGLLMGNVQKIYTSSMQQFSTSQLTNALEKMIADHPPPLIRGRRIKLRYAHQGGRNPPTVVIHGNQTEQVPESYQRYLVNSFRDMLELHGVNMKVEFKRGTNPYKGNRNQLTSRQITKRKRLKRHIIKRMKK